MDTTTRPDAAFYSRHGWDDDYMLLLARALRESDPARAARGVADYRQILAWEAARTELDKASPTTDNDAVQEEVDGLNAAIWGLQALEQALTGRKDARGQSTAPGPMAGAGAGAGKSLRALDAVAARPEDLNVRTQAAAEWLDALEEALPAEGTRGPLGQDPPTEGPRDSLMKYLDWPVSMAITGEVL